MSALAAILIKQGHKISGSDTAKNPQTIALKKMGCRIFLGHDAGNVPKNCERIIINGAISDDNPELLEAIGRGLEIVDRAALLSQIADAYENVIAITGTHGKSTTTAMIGAIFRTAGLKPTIHNGAIEMNVHDPLGNLQAGENKFFITEACEFKKSFLTLKPTVAVITNINEDHMDCYGTLDELKKSFKYFSNNAKITVINADCKNSTTIKDARRVSMLDIPKLEGNKARYKFQYDGMEIALKIPGFHNIMNAMLAIRAAQEFGIGNNVIKYALENFCGIQRRFQDLGSVEDCRIIIDYAHHPVEIATTIKTANSLYDKYLLVFQPHTYTRTRNLFNEFVSVLENTNVCIYGTYAAREKPIMGARAKDLADATGKKHFFKKKLLVDYIGSQCKNYDAIIFVGAGNIDNIAREIVDKQ